MKYGELTLGQVEAIANKLGGMNGIDRFLAGELVVVEKTVQIAPAQLNWLQAIEKSYGLMDLAKEYAEFASKFGVKEVPGQWVLPMIKGTTCKKVIKALKEAGSGFVGSYYNDLDSDTVHNDRDPNRDGSYLISVCATIEADEEHKNKSADTLAKEGHHGMTCLERLFLELVYFLMTGKHLDIKNITLCAGSRIRLGSVPDVSWSPGNRGVCVDFCNSGDANDIFRSRSVRVLPAKPSEALAEQASGLLALIAKR